MRKGQRLQAGSRRLLRNRQCLAEFQATTLTHMEFEPCDVGNSCCFAKVQQPCATRSSHSEEVQASVASVSLSSQLAQSHQKAMCVSANFSTLPMYLQSWLQCSTGPEAHTHWRKSSGWIQEWRQQRSAPRLSTAADQTRVRQDLIVELAKTRKGASPSPLRSLPNFTNCHRDGWENPRRRQNRRIRTPARHVVPDQRGYSSLQRRTVATIWHGWPLLGLSDHNAGPDVHWSPAKASAVIAWHREAAARDGKETTDDAH